MKSKFILLALIGAFALTSCRVSLVPTRSPEAITAVQNAATATDNLYKDIIGSSDKSYATYAAAYEAINKQITQILILDSERKRSGVILVIANDIHKRFQKSQSDHRLWGTINNSQAQSFNDYMQALFSALLHSENSFK